MKSVTNKKNSLPVALLILMKSVTNNFFSPCCIAHFDEECNKSFFLLPVALLILMKSVTNHFFSSLLHCSF